MSLVRFVRCKHCGLPHEVTLELCPFTGAPVVAVSPSSVAVPSSDALTDTRLMERYRIEAPIGMGGMGTVYRALDEEHVRKVAIKVLGGLHLQEERLVRRFTREVQAAGSVVHPNVVELLDAGALDDGTPFLVMELVPGRSLDRRLDAGTIPVAEAIAICDQLLAALECAHEAGVVHRDIKPANLIVEGSGTDVQVKVVDFGLSKFALELSSLTKTGEIVGTPHYVAPEQARGGEIDARADIWASGVVLYEMLTGETPFGEGAVAKVLMRVLSVEPDPPSTKRADVGRALDAVVLHALAKKPTERYQTAGEMRAGLREAIGASGEWDDETQPMATPPSEAFDEGPTKKH